MPTHDWSHVDIGLFHHFDLQWIAKCSTALNAGGLPPEYYALAEQRTAGRESDVLTLHRPTAQDDVASSGNGGTLVATAPSRRRFIQQSDADVYAAKTSRIVVRRVEGDVVAVIEIVSPGNKDSHVPTPLASTYELTWNDCPRPLRNAVLAKSPEAR